MKKYFKKLAVLIAILPIIISSSFADDITIDTTDGGQVIHTNHTGDTTITVEGIIFYTGFDALNVYSTIGDVFNNGTIESTASYTIYAYNMTGDITNYGTIKAGTSNGIYADSMKGNIYNDGTIEVGAYYGIEAFNLTGDITNYGTIKAGSDYGIGAIWMKGNIYNSGTIEAGNDYGIYARDMIGNIENHGTIKAGNDLGIYAYNLDGNIYNSGTIEAVINTGIYAELMIGDITNVSTGIIRAGNNFGIDAYLLTGNIDNNGTIEAGKDYGIFAESMTGDIDNDGTIEAGSDYGIYAFDMIGNITNYGTIKAGNNFAIDAKSMTGNIYNSGTIEAGNDRGINASYMTGNIYNDETGIIKAGAIVAIDAYNLTGDITNYGTIKAAYFAINADYMTGNIENYGTIEAAGNYAINATKLIGNIENYGTIEATTGGFAIYANSMTGDIYNEGTITAADTTIYATNLTGNIENYGTIKAGNNFAIDADSMTGDIYNDGTIEAGNDYGINASYMTGNIYNDETGIIKAAANRAIGATKLIGNIENYGTITATTGGFAIYANYMTGNIYNDGTIEAGNNYGIYANRMTGNIYNDNDGIIKVGDDLCIYAFGLAGAIENYGTIEAGSDYGIYASDMIGNITNYGTIRAGNDYGIYARDMNGNIENYGTIEAFVYGIYARDMVRDIENYGTIRAIDDYAIYMYGMDGFLYNYLGATIKAADYTVYGVANADTTIYNEGLIWSTAGAAIFGGGWSGAFNIIGDGEIIGIIAAGLDSVIGGSVLNITSSTGADLDQAEFYNWETINFLGTGDVTLQSGAVTTATILNFVTGGILTLTGINHSNINLNIQSGSYAFNSGTTVNSLTVQTGVTISTTIDVDAGTSGTLNVTDPGNGVIADGAILNIDISGTWEEGVSLTTYLIFDGGGNMVDAIDNNGFDLILSYGYTGEWDANYETITLSVDFFADNAGYYQTGFAELMDGIKARYYVDEIEALLAQYDYSGYASFVHSQLHGVNQRTSSLYNRLSDYEIYVSRDASSAMATANKQMRKANGNVVWFDVYSFDGSLDGEDSNTLDYDGYEVAIGLDHTVNDNLILGFSVHYNENSGDVATINYDSEGYGLDLYGQYKQGQFTHKLLLGMTEYNNDAQRAGAKADFDSDEFYISYRGEYTIKKEAFDIIPLFGLRYAVLNVDDITEGTGYGLEGYDYESIQTELGVKLLKAVERIQVWGALSWLQELGDIDVDAKGSSEFGNFDQKGLEADETIIRASLGLDYQLSRRLSLAFEYAHEFGDNTEVDSIDAKLSFSF